MMKNAHSAGVHTAAVLGILVFSGMTCLCAGEKDGQLKEIAGAVPSATDFNSAAGRQALSYESVEFDGDTLKLSADQLVRKAGDAYKDGRYQEAIDLYRKAKEKLSELSVRNESVKSKEEKCQEAISKCYYYWAEKLYFDAMESADQKQFEEAVQKCTLAAEIWPNCKERMDEAISKFRKMQDSAAYVQENSTDVLLPDMKESLYSIDVLMQQGNAFYREKQWSEARSMYEKVIQKDPYNMDAIEAIRRVNRQLIAAGKRRSQVTHNRYIAQADWTSVVPLISRMTDNDKAPGLEDSEDFSIVKESQTRKIDRKLDTILLDALNFEETEIAEIIRELKARSREKDKEREGINIIYLPAGSGTASAAASASEEGEEKKESASDTAAGTAEDATINVMTGNCSVREAIKKICTSGNLKYKVTDYAVLVAPKSVPLDETETRFYPVDDTLVDRMMKSGDLKTYFENQGFKFGEGTSVTHISGRLVVTNSPEVLAKIEEHLSMISSREMQVLVETKFVEIALNDMEELGFRYQVSRTNGNVQYMETSDLKKSGKTGIEEPNANKTTWNIYSSETDANGYHTLIGTWKPGDNTSILPANTTEFYYTKAPIQAGGSQVSFKANSYDLVGTINDISNKTVLDGVFSAQYTNNNGYKISAAMYAVDQADSSDYLFCPRVTTVSGYPASIKMVTEQYFPTDWSEAEIGTIAGTGGTNVPLFTPSIAEFDETEDLGIMLDVEPNVGDDESTISMKLRPYIREFVGWTDYSYPMTVSVADNQSETYTNIMKMPIFETRQVNTMVYCSDGETIILGGMVRDSTAILDDQYPLLGNIPLVGRLFQSKSKTSEKRNLLIFLTCRLIDPKGSPVRDRELRGLPAFRQ